MYRNSTSSVKLAEQERQFLISTCAVANGKVDRWRYECGRLAELIGVVDRTAAIDMAIRIAINNDIDERIGGLEIVESDVRDAFASAAWLVEPQKVAA